MKYEYIEKVNFENYASGRVIFHSPGKASFPIRLGLELFERAYQIIKKDKLCLYDPCCGNAYLPTVLGFIENSKIEAVCASDIDVESCRYAERNLSLLTKENLLARRDQLQKMAEAYHKTSHREAFESCDVLIKDLKRDIPTQVFPHNILSGQPAELTRLPDYIFADVPYGESEQWYGIADDLNPIEILLKNVYPLLSSNAVVALAATRHQKFSADPYIRVDRIKCGNRVVHMLKKSSAC